MRTQKKTAYYLDYNATAPVRAEVAAVMSDILVSALPYNASSVHAAGRAARAKLETARRVIADAVSCLPQEVIFTASGTEANHLALCGLPEIKSVIIGVTEHASVLAAPQGNTVFYAPVDAHGLIKMDVLEALLKDAPMPCLVSIMLANNETGVIQNIAEIAALARSYGALMHTDVIQALGKIPVDVGVLGVDMMTISAHKMGGAVGAAALIARQGVTVQPILRGGGQELRRRAGTENIAAITGFAKAIELAQKDTWQKPMRAALDVMEAQCEAHGGVILGKNALRLPNTSCIVMPRVPAETQLMRFDIEGFCISAGAACSSGRMEHSHVAQAMGMDATRGGVVRVSVGWNTTPESIEAFTQAWLTLASRHTE